MYIFQSKLRRKTAGIFPGCFIWETNMFKRLKECKTLKEIYLVLGNKPFEVIAIILLLIWIIMPLISTVNQIEIAFNENYDMARAFVITSDYQHNIQSLGLITLEFAVVYLLGRIILNKGQLLKKIKSEPWHYFLLAMLLWSCICTMLSDDSHTSFFGTGYRFEGLQTYFYYAAVYVCALVVANGKWRKHLLGLFSFVGNVVAILVVMQDYGIGFWKDVFAGQLAAMFFHFNHTGYFMNMTIVCTMGMYLFSESRKWRIWYLLSMLIQVFGLLVNSTFGAFLGSCCALVMLLVFFVRFYKKPALRMLAPVLVIIALSIASYFGYIPNSRGEDMRYNAQMVSGGAEDVVTDADDAWLAGHGRIRLWTLGLQMIPKRPIFGYGPEQLDSELAQFMWLDRPDNEFIQYAIFLGVPGLTFYLIALIWLFLHQWIRLKELDVTTVVAAGCVIAYLVSALFGNSMFYTTPYLFMFLAFASGRVNNPS